MLLIVTNEKQEVGKLLDIFQKAFPTNMYVMTFPAEDENASFSLVNISGKSLFSDRMKQFTTG